MDSKNNLDINSCYRLLALCARATPHPNMNQQLLDALHQFQAWHELPKQAELHGMAPLLWHHLQRLNFPIPTETKRTLHALYLRHRAHYQHNQQVLLDITKLFQSAGIRAILLKGLALAHQYYPEPDLRPVGDIDLLFKKDELLRALDCLTSAGYTAHTPQSDFKRLPKEVTFSSPATNGLSTRIELHHYDPQGKSAIDHSPDDEFLGFDAPPKKIKIGKQMIYVPDPINHLDYLVRHLTRHMFVATDSKPLSMKWIADIVCLVEQHAKEIDWEKNSALRHRLEVMYSLTPLPEKLQKVIPLKNVQIPKGVNQYPQGWPQQVFPQWKYKGFLYYLTKTFLSPRYIWHTLQSPSAWWLRLQYGIPQKSVFWYGQVVYRLQVLRMGFSKFWKN